MFKLLTHVLIFLVGAGAGVWWGVNHPSDAARIADTEQLRVEQAAAAAKQLAPSK
jgi:hypothetical protein